MNWTHHLAEGINAAISAVVASLVALIGWLIRVVFTNQKQIELLRTEMRHRDQMRNEDREALSDVRESVKRIEGVIMGGRKE